MFIELYEGKNKLGFLQKLSIFNMTVTPVADKTQAKAFADMSDAQSYANTVKIITKKRIESCIVK